MEQIRIIKEMRSRNANNGTTDIRPRYMVWENVPGAFSSNRGEDFGIVLEETAKVADENAVIPEPPKGKWTTSGCIMGDGWSIAWRVLDAQFWGVPQRRRRIALVADFGGHSAPEILFVRKGVSGDTEQGEQKRKDSTEDASGCFGTTDSIGVDGNNGELDAVGMTDYLSFQGWAGAGASLCLGKNVGASLSAKRELMVAYAVDCRNVMCSDGEVAGTLDASYYKGTGTRHGRERTYLAYCIGNGQANDAVKPEKELCKTLNCMVDPMKIVMTNNSRYTVRRLTPLECERLQGYPDGWTDIGDWTDSNGKVRKTSDAARYKALGNSIAIPPWKWVIKRLCACYERDATMASLFDGIGGFPYIWEQINGEGSCLWASEIEEFPIAVTKERIK